MTANARGERDDGDDEGERRTETTTRRAMLAKSMKAPNQWMMLGAMAGVWSR